MADQVAPVEDGEILLRTDFSPIHIQNGQLLAAAISSADLKDRGFSVDREHMVDPATIDVRAGEQMVKAPVDRQEAWISPFECGPVRADTYEGDGERAFRIEHDPVDGNDAHAAIYSSIPRSRSHIKGLKAVLLPHLNRGLRKLEIYKAERQR